MLSVQDLLLLNPPAPKFTFVQKAWNSTAGGSPVNTTVSLTSVAAGHLVVVSVDYLGTATGFTITIDDGNGNSFTLTPNSPFKYNALAPMVWLGYILSAAAGTMTVTVTPTVAHGLSVHVAEFSYSGTCSFDTDAGAFATTGTTPVNTPSITPGAPNVLLYATAIADPTGSGSFLGSGDGWVDGTIGVIASDSNNSADAYILVESGLKKVNWATSFSTGTGWVAAAMSFKVTTAAGAMTGSSAGSSTATGTLTGAGALSGSAAGVASSASTLKGSGALAGTAAGVATGTASLSGAGALAGTAAGVASSTATLVGDAALIGTAAGVASSTAQLQGAGALVGSSAGVATASGTLTGSGGGTGVLTGSAAGTSTASGTLTATGALAGTSAGTSTASGTAQGAAALQGTAAGSATAAGLLLGLGLLSGTAAGFSTALGILTNIAFVDFLVANCFATAAVNLTMEVVPAVNLTVTSTPAVNIDLKVTQ